MGRAGTRAGRRLEGALGLRSDSALDRGHRKYRRFFAPSARHGAARSGFGAKPSFVSKPRRPVSKLHLPASKPSLCLKTRSAGEQFRSRRKICALTWATSSSAAIDQPSLSKQWPRGRGRRQTRSHRSLVSPLRRHLPPPVLAAAGNSKTWRRFQVAMSWTSSRSTQRARSAAWSTHRSARLKSRLLGDARISPTLRRKTCSKRAQSSPRGLSISGSSNTEISPRPALPGRLCFVKAAHSDAKYGVFSGSASSSGKDSGGLLAPSVPVG